MRILPAIAVAASLMLACGPASAVDEDIAEAFLGKKWSVWLGGFFPKVHSTIRLDGPGPGDTIDVEDTLGLEDGKTVPFGGIRWRFNRRHQLEGEYIQLKRSSVLEATSEDLDIGDYEVRIGARIETDFDVAVGRLTYGYNLLDSPRNSLHLKAGLHIADFDTKLRLSGAVFEGGVPIEELNKSFVDESADITAPLPHFGASWAYALSDRFALRAQGLVFALKIDDWRGSLVDLGFDAQYLASRRFGIGAGLRYFRAMVENDDPDRTFGKFVYEYYGPVVYGVVSF